MEIEDDKENPTLEENDSSENDDVFVSDHSEEEEDDEWKVGIEQFDANLKSAVNNFTSIIKPSPINIPKFSHITPFEIFLLFLIMIYSSISVWKVINIL